MQSFHLDDHDLSKLDERLASAARRTPEIKREVLQDVGEDLLAQVQSKIGGSGKVRRWQHVHTGSGGGYVAVHAKEKETDKYGRAVGAVTNAIESGHRFPSPTGKNKRYKFRNQSGRARVPGKHMYQSSSPEAAASAASARLGERLTQNLEE